MRNAIGGLVLVLSTCGCASTSGSELARDRASREFACEKERIRVGWLSSTPRGEAYKVGACGNVVTYICNQMEGTCFLESPRERR